MRPQPSTRLIVAIGVLAEAVLGEGGRTSPELLVIAGVGLRIEAAIRDRTTSD